METEREEALVFLANNTAVTGVAPLPLVIKKAV